MAGTGVSVKWSQENFSADNPKSHMWPERTQQAEHFLSRNLVSTAFP